MYVLCNEAPYIKKSPKVYEMDKPDICPVCGERVDGKNKLSRDIFRNIVYGNFFLHEGGHIVSNDLIYLMMHKTYILNYKRFISKEV